MPLQIAAGVVNVFAGSVATVTVIREIMSVQLLLFVAKVRKKAVYNLLMHRTRYTIGSGAERL